MLFIGYSQTKPLFSLDHLLRFINVDLIKQAEGRGEEQSNINLGMPS